MTEDKISKVEKKEPILTLGQAREMEGFREYQDGIYKYKQNGIDRLIYKGTDYAEGLGAIGVWGVQFNKKEELVFAFKTEKGWGLYYNGEIIGGEWKNIREFQFNVKGELACIFKTEKGRGLYYNGEILGGDWKDVWIDRNYIAYKTQNGGIKMISYEELKKPKKRLDK